MPGPRSNPTLGGRGIGKTQFDRISGKLARHLRNQRARATWNETYMSVSKGGGGKEIPYPVIPVKT